MKQHPYIEYLYIAAIALLLFFFLRLLIKQYKEKRAATKRFKRGAKLEKEGRDFLIKQGYKIEHEQYLAHHVFYVDGQRESIGIIPDYIVSKQGKTYIVDVKSGRSAITLKDKATRRQLLEYDSAIPNDGIFLLDMENETLKHVHFESWKTLDTPPRPIVSQKKNYKNTIIFVAIISILLFIIYTLL